MKRTGALAQRLALIAASGALILALCRPLLFTDSIQAGDWFKNLWMIWQQSLALHANHTPSYFLYLPYKLFYPLYAFYGGTLYALTGALSLMPGFSLRSAYVGMYVLGFAAAYGGWYWMARMAGLGRWLAAVPGTLFITSSYYLTTIYNRGDWAEFIAVSMIPLLLAAGYSVLRAERLRLAPALALAASTLLFTGSHNLTLLWCTTILGLLGLALVILVPATRQAISARGVGRVASVVLPAALLNAWYLLPDLSYQSHTNIAEKYKVWSVWLRETVSSVWASNLFTFIRVPGGTPAPFDTALPLLAIAWIMLALLLLAPRLRRLMWWRILLIVSIATTAVGVLMTHPGLVLALPRLYTLLQFTHRLEQYVFLGISGAVLAVLVLTKHLPRHRQAWRLALVPILAASLVGALQQVSAYLKEGHISMAALRAYDAELGDYVGVDLPFNKHTRHLSKVVFPAAALHGERVSITVHLRPNQLVDSNLFTYDHLVSIHGARMIALDGVGYALLRVDPAPAKAGADPTGPRTETITVSAANPPPVVLGRIVTLGAAVALLLRFGLLLAGLPRARKARAALAVTR